MEVWITFIVQQAQFNRFRKIVILHQPPYTFEKWSGRLSPVGDLQLTQMNKGKQEHHHRKVKGRAVYTKT